MIRVVSSERVSFGGSRVRHQHHVRLVDALPATDGGTIEHLAFFEEAFVNLVTNGYVLLFTLGVGKTQINKLDFVFWISQNVSADMLSNLQC